MIPLSLRVTNFRSVRGTQTFHFPRAPGLYFMQGVNEVESRLEANAAGKSTLWEALTWCWFNKTSRGLKAGDVCNWDAGKGTVVEFDFLHSEDYASNKDLACVWTMRRTWGPISWTLSHSAEYVTDEETVDLAKEKDNPALSWLGLDFDQWLNCVLNAQGQPMFLDLKRDAQAGFFSTVVGADAWLDRSARAGKLASGEDRRVRDMEREASRLQGELDARGSQDFHRSAGEWERDRDERLAKLEEEHAEGKAQRKRLQELLNGAQERETNARAWVASSQPDAGLAKDRQRAGAEVSDFESMSAEQRGRAATLRDQLERLDGGEDCPVCGQRLGAAHKQAEKRRLTADLRKADAAVAKYDLHAAGSRERLEQLNGEFAEQQDEAEKARAELDDAQRAAGALRRSFDLCDRELDSVEDAHERLLAERNPYADMEARAREEAARLRAEADDLQRRIDAASSRQALFQFWVRGFKDVRLAKIDEALTELEVEVNSGVDALGLLGWELQFQVDRETKGGKIERGFDCLVRSPHNDAAVPWAAWSGGEAQRLRLAGTMGLSDLIRSRTGATIALEVWDEPTEGLSPQGIRDLLECLQERAAREGRCIWVVDHRSHDFGGFAGTVVVRKTDRGTVIESGISKP